MRPIQPTPMRARLRIEFIIWVLKPASPQELPVALRVITGRAGAGQHVLLDHDPAGVVRATQLGCDGGEVDVAFAQFAEYSVFERLEIIPLAAARLRVHRRAAVFVMDVPDAVAMTLEAGYRLTASKSVVAGIKAEA